MSRRYQNAINYQQKVTDSGSVVQEGDTANIKEELDETIDPEAKELERKDKIKESM
jgi:transcription initiation factor IIE alpha subunit